MTEPFNSTSTNISSSSSSLSANVSGSGSTTYRIPPADLVVLMKNISDNLNYIHSHKTYIQPETYHNLNNYHNYILNILNDVKGAQLPQIKKGPRNDVYTGSQFPSQPCPWSTPSCPWETQFDQTIHNPSLYSLPPNNTWAQPPWQSSK